MSLSAKEIYVFKNYFSNFLFIPSKFGCIIFKIFTQKHYKPKSLKGQEVNFLQDAKIAWNDSTNKKGVFVKVFLNFIWHPETENTK
jgi:hypothetical protein